MKPTHTQSKPVKVEELWLLTVLIATLVTQVAECILLEYKFFYFTSGDKTDMTLSISPSWIIYLGLSVFYDFLLISFLVLITCLTARRVFGRSSVAFLALICPVAITWTFTGIEYRVFSYFRDNLDFHLLRSLGGGNLGDSIRYVSPELWNFAVPIFILVAVAGLALYVLRRYPNFILPSPNLSRLSITVITLVCLAVSIVGGLISRQIPELRFGLEKKLSFIVFTGIADKLTDFDFDGYGFFASLPDPALFDARIHPYALDLPNNGLDENGLAGDLPKGSIIKLRKATQPDPLEVQHKRSVILIVLETMRWDVLQATVNGHEVAPNLRQLAREGLSVPIAFSHDPVSEITLQNIYLGHTCPGLVSSSIFDDFAALGYETAIFSAADESYGGTDKIVGLNRVQNFYDARTEPRFRIYPGNLPMSRMIGAEHLNRRIFKFLEKRDPLRPLFLYVNYQDAHFPYYYPELQNILNGHPIPRLKIRPDTADWLRRTYLNAVANVDRAVGLLIGRLREMKIYDDTVILIVGDHGEELFEEGYMGHGSTLNDLQTRIPFILVHGGIEVRYPLGLDEVRWILRRTLNADQDDGPGHVVLDENKQVFQYLGYLKRPKRIALASADGRIAYDFQRGRVLDSDGKWRPFDTQSLDSEAYKEVTSLIHTWEACKLFSGPPKFSESNLSYSSNNLRRKIN